MTLFAETKTETRRLITARAVRALRSRLGWSQPKLARTIHEDLDGGTVSRWERAVLAPDASNRDALFQLAQKHGYRDLLPCFGDTENWRLTIEPAERSLLGLFGIVMLNHEYVPGDGQAIPGKQFQELKNALYAAVKTLNRADAAGKHILIATDEQAAAWLEEIATSKSRTGTRRRAGKKIDAAQKPKLRKRSES
jgi:DNA-binding transcriptional regulator YiaG